MAQIHPTAIIDPTAELADDVKVGPYCIIGPHVKLGEGCVLHNHVVLGGPSTFGKGNEFFPFSVIGLKTQDLKYKGEPTWLEVGDYNVFRENCNINRSTTPETKTIIGSHNLFLINSHAGHECVIGNHCILSGFAAVAGHCTVGDWAIIGGCSAMHQFVRVGEHAMIGGAARITQDLAPYMIAEGNPAMLRTVNTVGLQRRGFSEEDIKALKFAYRKLFLNKKDVVTDKIPEVLADATYGSNPRIATLINFLQTSERSFLR